MIGSRRDLAGLLLAIVAVNVIGAFPALFIGADTGWFEKPWFFPPEYLFGIVWTILFTLKGIALYLVVRAGFARPGVRRALGVFVGQFMLNLLWTPAFFGLRRPDLGLFVILALIVAILATIVLFSRIDRRAGILLVPYLAWTAFAAVLNGAIAFGMS